MTRGLGKGLNSLIQEIYDENFDSNGAQSLEDILNEKSEDDITEKESSEDIIVEETEKDDNKEPDVDEVVECYTYFDGVAGLEFDDDDEDAIEEYYENIYENICVEEITLQEFNDFVEKDGLEIR